MPREHQTYAFNDRRYWTARKVGDKFIRTTLRCGGCGYRSPHYAATYDPEYKLFAVPFSGLNGGIGTEVDASGYEFTRKTELDVLLSKCCDYPRAVDIRRLDVRTR